MRSVAAVAPVVLEGALSKDVADGRVAGARSRGGSRERPIGMRAGDGLDSAEAQVVGRARGQVEAGGRPCSAPRA